MTPRWVAPVGRSLIVAPSGGGVGELLLVETLAEAVDFWASPRSDAVIVLAGSLFSLYEFHLPKANSSKI
jgi:hypothetical protein